jgi:hypothetical protein
MMVFSAQLAKGGVHTLPASFHSISIPSIWGYVASSNPLPSFTTTLKKVCDFPDPSRDFNYYPAGRVW